MHLATLIYTFFNGKFVGKDQYGNSYYQTRKKANIKEQKRWVLYKGVEETSKIPPLWHRWIHYMTDELPNEKQLDKFDWQKNHEVNFTATHQAYHPQTNELKYENKKHYTAWNAPTETNDN